MKKIIILSSIAVALCLSTATIAQQKGLTPQALAYNGGASSDGGGEWNIPSTSPDTIVKSTTYFWVADASSFKTAQDVSFTIAIDSVGGTPNATVTEMVSNDRQHWSPTGSAIVFNSAKNYWWTSSTVPAVSDSAVTVNTNPWIGKYIGIKIVFNSNTQRGIYHIKIKACNIY